MKKILFTGGGSGGHVIPNLALIELLKDKAELYYVGGNGMEKTMLSYYSYVKFFEYNPPKLKRSFALSNLKIPFNFLSAQKQAEKILLQIKPDVVFSKGGYVGLPVVLSAHKLSIPTYGHESDSSLGLAHKLALKKYKTLFTAFPLKQTTQNISYAGALLRPSIVSGNAKKGLSRSGFNGQKPILLVMGGSLGAYSLNQKIFEYSSVLCVHYDIFLITGKGKNLYQNTPSFHTAEFVSDVQNLYACAHLCITRGGANALCELVACKLPFLAVPLSKASRNEQGKNAEFFSHSGTGRVIPERDLTCQKLLDELEILSQNRQSYVDACKAISLYATSKLADFLLNC